MNPFVMMFLQQLMGGFNQNPFSSNLNQGSAFAPQQGQQGQAMGNPFVFNPFPFQQNQFGGIDPMLLMWMFGMPQMGMGNPQQLPGRPEQVPQPGRDIGGRTVAQPRPNLQPVPNQEPVPIPAPVDQPPMGGPIAGPIQTPPIIPEREGPFYIEPLPGWKVPINMTGLPGQPQQQGTPMRNVPNAMGLPPIGRPDPRTMNFNR